MFIIQAQDDSALIIIYSLKELSLFYGYIINYAFKMPDNYDLPQMSIFRYTEIKKDFVGYDSGIYNYILYYFADKEPRFFEMIDKNFTTQAIVNKFLSKYGYMHRTVPVDFKNTISMKTAFLSCATVENFNSIPEKYKKLEFLRFAYSINKDVIKHIDKNMRKLVMYEDQPKYEEYNTPFPWIAFPFEASYMKTQV